MNILPLFLIGLAGGIMGGALGLGGGGIMVPLMIYVAGMTQHQAQGTVLAAMLPPVFVLAVWSYYQQGHINVKMASIVAVGLLIGAFGGAQLANALPAATLKKIFAVVLILIGIKMFLK